MMLDEGRIRNAKIAIAYYFFCLGSELGCWAGILPRIKKDHDLSNTTLGGILVAAVFGAILALPTVTMILEKYGSRFSLIAGGVISPLLFPVIGVNSHISIFIIAVFLLGFGSGWFDISMNAQAVLCEKVSGKATLGLFHCLYAIGGLSGALFGGGLLDAGANPLQVTFLGSIILLIPQLIVVWWLYDKEEQKYIEENQNIFEQEEQLISPLHRPSKQLNDRQLSLPSSSFSSSAVVADKDTVNNRNSLEEGKVFLPSSITSSSLWNTMPSEDLAPINPDTPKPINYTMLWSISALCFIGYFGQGSIGDWSAIYLSDDLNASALECTFGYVGFELFVAIGTFISDKFVNAFGRKLLLEISGILSAVGLFLAVMALSSSTHTGSMALAITGFSISGLGLSVVSLNDSL